MKIQREQTNSKIIRSVCWIALIVNFSLLILKILFGIIFNNLAIISEAIHAATDLIISFSVLIAVYFTESKFYPKLEKIMTILLGILVCSIGVMLAYNGYVSILNPQPTNVNLYTIGFIIFTIIIKELLFYYELYYAKKTKSNIILAEAWHNRMDNFSSVTILVGFFFSLFFDSNIFESLSVIIISTFIMKTAIDLTFNLDKFNKN